MKTGRLPKRPDDPKVHLEAFLRATPSVPDAIDWSLAVKDWGMLENDKLGDCVPAGVLHSAQLATALASTEFKPTNDNAILLYQLIGHFDPFHPDTTDRGCVMYDAMQQLVDPGFLGQKLEAFADINISNLDTLKLACHLFGPVPIGIEFPASASEQFDKGEPWDVTDPPAKIEGGHCVVVVGYDENYYYVVTWGKVWKATPAFMTKYLDEAYVMLSKLWVMPTSQTPGAVDYDALVADFNALPKVT